MTDPNTAPKRRALISGVAACFLWGILPIYWKQIKHVPAYEILAHRILWSLIFTTLLIHCIDGWRWLGAVMRSKTILKVLCASALLIAMNWLAFVWGVNSGFVLECSLGYFICPLVTIFLAAVVLKEKLSRLQVAAICLAALAVCIKSFGIGTFPWLSLFLAFTFATYALLRKVARLESLQGLFLESLLLAPLALIYIFYLTKSGLTHFAAESISTDLLLALSGPVTAVPLLFYAYSARRIRLATLGIINYLAPSMQFILAVFVYGEPFSLLDLASFTMIWLAVFLYMRR